MKEKQSVSLLTSNTFSALEDGCGMNNSKADEGTLLRVKTLVVGDSHVRFMDRLFCGKDRKKKTRVCLPDTGIRNVGER